jgi:alpha-L-rhamnosidase
LCMLDTYVDCSGHEQNFWVGDARITAIINLLTYGAYRLNQHHIRIIGQSLRPEWVKTFWANDERYTSGRYLPFGAFPNYPEGSLPMWTFLWMIQCWEHYLYSADMTDLEENFGYVAETIRHCRLLTNERGLFDMPGAWNLIEWANNDLSPYGEVTANNVLLVKSLRLAAKMAKILGRSDQALEYENEAQSRMDAINRYCWDENRQAYVDTVRDRWAFDRYLKFCESQGMATLPFEKYLSGIRVSEQTNTLALLSDCVPPERLEGVKKIVQRVLRKHFVAGAPFGRSFSQPSEKEAPDGIVAVGSPFFLFFSLEALFKIGEAPAALDMIRSGWAVMVESGTKGCWETFKYNDRNWTRSISHAWSAAPAVYLPTEILGVKPVEPGYRKFTIEPKAEALTWARGAVTTPFGPIQVRWSRESNGTLKIDYSAPQGCERV